MAFLGKAGNVLRQSATKKIGSEVSPLKLSIYQAVRCTSSKPNSKLFVGGIPSQTDKQAFDVMELLGRRVRMNDAIYGRSFGGIGAFGGSGYGVRSYSGGGVTASAAVASYSSNTALANAAGGSVLNLALFWHINNGIREILADYVHHEMTRNVILVYLRLFLIIAAKDVFVSLVF